MAKSFTDIGIPSRTPLLNPTLALCFESDPVQDPINVIKACIEEIISFGGKLIEGPITEGFGVEAWFSDIEDNYFLVFVPLLDLDKK